MADRAQHVIDAIGSGRRHGQRPTGGGPELDLYLAARSSDDPTPQQVAGFIRWYRTLPGCSNGGSLHIVIEDGNTEDYHVTWCSGYAAGVGDTCGSELAGLLYRLTEHDRDLASDPADKP